MYVFSSLAVYSNGNNVNDVINLLQDKYGFLDKYDNYVFLNLDLFKCIDDKYEININMLNNELTELFKQYILDEFSGIITKGGDGISFVDTGLMLMSTTVSYAE